MEERDSFTPFELHGIEIQIPAYERAGKINASVKLRRTLEDPAKRGGVFSKLDPINSWQLRGFGVPTIPLDEECVVTQPFDNIPTEDMLKDLDFAHILVQRKHDGQRFSLIRLLKKLLNIH